ncbi:GTP pyrophosphokinase [bacterium HR34]|nr:GTP pyrophosphokinase [bacterium HR34]
MKATKANNLILDIESESDLVKKAFEFSKNAHEGQKRYSGEPYINHPLRVAKIVKDLKLSDKAVAAALLHDVPEDTKYTIKDIEDNFGEEIAMLVKGVTELGKLRYPKEKFSKLNIKPNIDDYESENLRKMFFAMGEDIRVIIIKIADRLDNMRTLEYVPDEKKPRLAFETMEIFAPIAERLGIGKIKGELEDLAFKYLYPEEYKYAKGIIDNTVKEKQKYLEKVKRFLLKYLSKNGIKPVAIDSRIKHYWSFYKKLLRYDMDVDKIYDIIALRIIVNKKEECYKTLGLIHEIWKPLPGRIKDYIALPKPNGYQSLHTTVFSIGGKIIEIQIRTVEMHLEAEFGICSHWSFKEKVNPKKLRKKFAWIQQLNEWLKNTSGSKEFLEGLRLDFFKERIFIFTPKGDVIDLPEGSTPVDFAYAVHTEIGNKCSKAKVNGKLVPLSHELKNFDVVEIITDKNKSPSPHWLQFVKTRLAKSRIKEFLEKEKVSDYLKAGEEILDKELIVSVGKKFAKLSKKEVEKILEKTKLSSASDLLLKIGKGEILASQVAKYLLEKDEKPRLKIFEKIIPKRESTETQKVKSPIVFGGQTNIAFYLSKCCNPQKGDEIVAFITRDRGASVHKKDCKIIKDLIRKWPERIMEADWSEFKPSVVYFEIQTKDNQETIKNIFDIINEMKIEIIENIIKTDKKTGDKQIILQVKVNGVKEIMDFIDKIKTLPNILIVKKVEKNIIQRLLRIG